ncbi:unnamed protein product [Periconia digitata]|uniref:Xylanolytic transcriptional activator regulatory domain-containing protein n=1 Tax=Periconia digitata TaxID=1303443 RepID=A0A9W4U6S5_9PLEO|nr:unnamed protein product [Periconia digitata]
MHIIRFLSYSRLQHNIPNMSAPLRPLLSAISGVKRRDPPVPIEAQQAGKGVLGACEACRLYKSKVTIQSTRNKGIRDLISLQCSGERPTCRACIGRRVVCRYTQTEARKVRQKYEDLQKRQSAHEELLSLMRTLPEQDATELFLRVRAGGDSATIVKHVQDGNLLLQLQLVPETRFRYELPYSRDMPALLLASGSPYLNSLIYEAASQRALHSHAHGSAATEPNHRVFPAEYASSENRSEYVKPYHAAVFVEPRLENLKPSEWTTVSKDDALMRELLVAYFTHEYHLWPIFQKDYFLEDMAKPKPDHRKTSCCSALLVNATLAYACYCFKKIPNRFRYWETESLGYRFLAEAKRIWEMQIISGKYRHLASVQAALIINIVHDLHGLDKIGDTYGRKGWAIAQEMQLFDGNAHILSDRVRNARNFTAWCLFGIDSHLAWQFFRHPFLAKPPMLALPDPSVNAAWYGEIWLRYPLSETLSPTNYGHVFKALSEFRVILGELCHASFGTDSNITAEQAMVFVSRLLAWYKKLPIPLMPKHIVLPAHLLMHLDYQIVLMITCQPFINDEWDDEYIPKNIVSNAERDINVLVRLYHLRHGFEDPHVYLTSPLVKLGFMSLHSINDQTPPEILHYTRSSLLLALKGLREQGRNYYITRTVYHIIKNQLRSEEARLLRGTEDPESELDKSPELESEIQSAWTPTVVDISDGASEDELSKLAKRFLKLDSGEQSDSEAGSSSPLPV